MVNAIETGNLTTSGEIGKVNQNQSSVSLSQTSSGSLALVSPINTYTLPINSVYQTVSFTFNNLSTTYQTYSFTAPRDIWIVNIQAISSGSTTDIGTYFLTIGQNNNLFTAGNPATYHIGGGPINITFSVPFLPHLGFGEQLQVSAGVQQGASSTTDSVTFTITYFYIE